MLPVFHLHCRRLLLILNCDRCGRSSAMLLPPSCALPLRSSAACIWHSGSCRTTCHQPSRCGDQQQFELSVQLWALLVRGVEAQQHGQAIGRSAAGRMVVIVMVLSAGGGRQPQFLQPGQQLAVGLGHAVEDAQGRQLLLLLQLLLWLLGCRVVVHSANIKSIF